jgi:chitin synthase
MYLAEDRILCFELVSKRKCRWVLQYVKSATGETDMPDTIAELILQRRRWPAIYAITHFYQLFRSDHSFFRQIAFLIEFLYQTVNMVFAWFAIGNFYLVFRILTTSLGAQDLLGSVGRRSFSGSMLLPYYRVLYLLLAIDRRVPVPST